MTNKCDVVNFETILEITKPTSASTQQFSLHKLCGGGMIIINCAACFYLIRAPSSLFYDWTSCTLLFVLSLPGGLLDKTLHSLHSNPLSHSLVPLSKQHVAAAAARMRLGYAPYRPFAWKGVGAISYTVTTMELGSLGMVVGLLWFSVIKLRNAFETSIQYRRGAYVSPNAAPSRRTCLNIVQATYIYIYG